jgi:exodeoxyribonuclease-3
MKIVTWNINGWRAMMKKEHLKKMVFSEKPDIICLQETKINPTVKIEYEGYTVIQHTDPSRPGYSGVAVLIKNHIKPIRFKKNKTEGRLIMVEFEEFYLINVYTPNSGANLQRLDYRVNVWDTGFSKLVKSLINKKQVIVVGDLNVARTVNDIKNAKGNMRGAGFTFEERSSFENMLKQTNMVDVWREQNPEKEQYSYFSYMGNARAKNAGWRIDYVLSNKDNIKDCKIHDTVLGSDHVPIIFEI